MSTGPTLKQATATRCQHVYKNGRRCKEQGNECWIDGWKPNEAADDYYCDQHMYDHGFCEGCGLFNGGIEEFDFNPNHLCDDCESEMRAEIEGDEEDGQYNDDY